ncbi:hypothetical protein CCY99_05390 [Helicobacter sp. 16-1353]|uniref:helix-turn-helix domain-containing protein n=1 Tax=Helicobacter sp. 16-1353 TaxID=2004996 RepID=UPI000DCCE5F9|nr:AraC family transcriptional regulator [Helicobacter sp. 16-1353]RAX53817.1 hypothetical protein CCY99_05390 [Helicobacter sp. 16-1353]
MISKDKNASLLDCGDVVVARYSDNCNKNYHISNSQNSIIFINKGQKILHFNNNSYVINEGEIVFLKAGKFVMSDIVSLKDGVYQSYFLSFSNMMLLKFINRHKYLLDRVEPKSKDREIFKITTDVFLVEQIKSINVFLDNKNQLVTNTHKEILKLKIEALLLLLMNREDRVFSEFIQNIANSFPFDFHSMLLRGNSKFASVKEMADTFNMDIALFSKRFKNSFGISPKEWLDNKRFERAKLFIEFSNKNITEICQEFNFNSVSWFIKRFRLRYGKTPKQLQKANNSYYD